MSLLLKYNPMTHRNRNVIANRIFSSYKNRISSLDYNFISFSSQDPKHHVNSIKSNLTGQLGEGWLSNRYCAYPQEILIKFPTEVNIRQLNILINESKIPKKIELINCIPVGKKNKILINGDKNIKLIPSEFMYENIGYINFSSNAENKYKLRELRKIYINVNSEYLKFRIYQNHNNDLNIFCQVGIIALNICGQKLERKQKKRKISPLNERNKTNNSDDETLFDICFSGEGLDEKVIEEKLDKKTNEKIEELTKEMDLKKKNEMYDECKFIRDKIDKIKKISLQLYVLEEEKKESANKNDFDRAQEIKTNIQKIGKLLQFYSSDAYQYNEKKQKEDNKPKAENPKNNKNNAKKNNIISTNYKKIEDIKNNNNNKKTEKLNVSQSHQQQELIIDDILDYDDIIVPSLQNKLKGNNISVNQSLLNNAGNSFDSFENSNSKEFDQQEVRPLEELSDLLKIKYKLLIPIVGEETIRKIFSKCMGYRKEGLKFLNEKVPDILNHETETKEVNKYIPLLMDIINKFINNKHSSIVFESLDIFNNILTSISNKSKENNILYDFTITKRTLRKIKEKLNDISKLVREKAENLYYIMLESDFCDYNMLLIELIEKELINQFDKNLEAKKNHNHNQYLFYDNYNSNNIIPEDKSSNHLIITKMKIYLKALEIFDDAVTKNKTDKERFPQNILEDFIIMNINHQNNDVREITKKVAIRFISIFGNDILEKMNFILDEKEIIKTEKELKKIYEKIKKEEKKNVDVSQSHDNLFLTNVNKIFPLGKKGKLLKPIGNTIKKINYLQKPIWRSSSQPKLNLNKPKLKPIPNKKKIHNSSSQKEIVLQKK
jgi:hypothetical protein